MPSPSLRALLVMMLVIARIVTAQNQPAMKTGDTNTRPGVSGSPETWFALHDGSANHWGLLPPGTDPV